MGSHDCTLPAPNQGALGAPGDVDVHLEPGAGMAPSTLVNAGWIWGVLSAKV